MRLPVLIRPALLFAGIILLGCSRHSVTLPRVENYDDLPEIVSYVKDHDAQCSRIYRRDNIWIIEVSCDLKDMKNGIYLVDGRGVRSFGWFDKEFNSWAWREGCSDQSSCFYEVSLNEREEAVEIVYRFYINLSEGFYRLRIDGSRLIIIEKSIFDIPS